MKDTERLYCITVDDHAIKHILATLTDEQYAAIELMFDDINNAKAFEKDDYPKAAIVEISWDMVSQNLPEIEEWHPAYQIELLYHGVPYYWASVESYVEFLNRKFAFYPNF